MSSRRYVFIGAGAIGGVVGGLLVHDGHRVVLVARGPHLDALRKDGLRLRTPDADLRLDVKVVGSADEIELTTDDVLVFAVKTQHIDAALLDWADRPVRDGSGGVAGTAAEVLAAITLTNGVTAEDAALRYFARVYAATIYAGATFLTAGEVAVNSAPVSAVVHIGRWPAGAVDDEDRALLSEVGTAWTSAGVLVNVTDDPRSWKYAKLISNLHNAPQALLGPGVDDAGLVHAARVEAVAILTRLGYTWASSDEVAAWRAKGLKPRPVPGLDLRGSSTWQSLERGTGSVEVDYLNGEIVRLARVHGLVAPINEALARLSRQAARRRGRGGAFSPAELAELVGIAPTSST